MSRLVPEKRVDKNGRVVTKHVLTDKPPTGSKDRVFPVPAGEKIRLASRADYGAKIAKALLEPDEVIKAEHYYSNEFSMRTLRRINTYVDALEPDNKQDRGILARALTDISSKGDERSYNDRRACILVEIMPVISGFAAEESVRIPYRVSELVSAVNYGAKVNRIIFEKESTPETTALLQYTAFEYIVMNINYAHPKESLLEAASWFTENAEKLALHSESIIKRGSIDRDLLNELVSEDRAASLANGTL